MRHTKPLVISALTAAMALSAGPAFALPGDSEINSSSPFRLDGRHLAPGCFVAGSHGMWRYNDRDVDVDSHLVFGWQEYDSHGGSITEEIHVTVGDGAPFSVDQVLVASYGDGYKIYNEFDTGTVNDDPDIDPGQTATGLVGNKRFIDEGATIVCVSSHPWATPTTTAPTARRPTGSSQGLAHPRPPR
jgi:hypothetical protein